MYIPITKTEEKCAGQLSYGFNIQDKLEGCTHEKKIPYGDLDFSKKVSKVSDFGSKLEPKFEIFALFVWLDF